MAKRDFTRFALLCKHPDRARAFSENPRRGVWACISRVSRRRGVLLWTKPAPYGGLRRARNFLFPARPKVGPRQSKILAKILELRTSTFPAGVVGDRAIGAGGYDPELRPRAITFGVS